MTQCYDNQVACRICELRKPRRFCPGVAGDICAPCCGAEREVTVSCPLDCEYLIEARRHERFVEIPEAEMPNRDVRITEEFLNEHDRLLGMVSEFLLRASTQTAGAIDADVREALAALIQTLRTSQSGLIYETRPANPIASGIQAKMNEQIDDLRRKLSERTGGTARLLDSELLGVLIFLQRIALHWDNKRPRGRAFVSFLWGRHNELEQQVAQSAETAPPPSSLIIP